MTIDHALIEQVLARGTKQQIGRYRLDLTTGEWWWSAETFHMHGFEPGEVVPTTALILAHKHPQDRDGVRVVLEEAMRTGEPFSSVHRIMDARGHERSLVVVGQGRRDRESGEVTELVGYFVDVTQVVVHHAQQRARHDIAAAAENRGPIEQAKGMIALLRGTDTDEAFEMLRKASNDRNVTIRDLARLVVDEGSHGAAGAAERIVALLR